MIKDTLQDGSMSITTQMEKTTINKLLLTCSFKKNNICISIIIIICIAI